MSDKQSIYNAQSIYNQYMYSYPHKEAYRPIAAEVVKKYLEQMQAGSLYVHIPFCESKCGYCNLFSKMPVGSEIEEYLGAVSRQVKEYASYINRQQTKPKQSLFKEVILGGGTPLILNEKQLKGLFGTLEETFGIDYEAAFVGIETSPHQTQKEKMNYLKEKGINRVSIGVQSFHDTELTALKRKHLSKDVHQALTTLKNINFERLNIDLIYGVPGQTLESLKASLEQALMYAPDEIFIYPLYIRKHTGLYGTNGVEETLKQEMYRFLAAYLKSEGYKQTSMRRFVRHQEASYSCGFEEMIAVGCGGRSYIGNLHFCEPYSAKAVNCTQTIRAFNQKGSFLEGLTGYILNENEQKRRFVIKNLMYHRGIALKEYNQLWQSKLEYDFPVIAELMAKKWVVQEAGFMRLTEEGLGLSDYIGPFFMSDEVVRKMQEGRTP